MKQYFEHRKLIVYPQDFHSDEEWRSILKQLGLKEDESKFEKSNFLVLHVARAELK